MQELAGFCFKDAGFVGALLCEAGRMPQGRGYSLKRELELPKRGHILGRLSFASRFAQVHRQH